VSSRLVVDRDVVLRVSDSVQVTEELNLIFLIIQLISKSNYSKLQRTRIANSVCYKVVKSGLFSSLLNQWIADVSVVNKMYVLGTAEFWALLMVLRIWNIAK